MLDTKDPVSPLLKHASFFHFHQTLPEYLYTSNASQMSLKYLCFLSLHNLFPVTLNLVHHFISLFSLIEIFQNFDVCESPSSPYPTLAHNFHLKATLSEFENVQVIHTFVCFWSWVFGTVVRVHLTLGSCRIGMKFWDTWCWYGRRAWHWFYFFRDRLGFGTWETCRFYCRDYSLPN